VSYRRIFGLLLGTLLGLTFGLVSQGINRLVLPGVPLYQPPFGPAGNAAVATLIGAVLGGVAAWPAGSLRGTFIASGLAAALIVIVNFAAARVTERGRAGVAMAAIFMLLPLVGLAAPLLGIFRWIVNRELEARQDFASTWYRVRGPLALVIVLGAAGAFALYPGEARHELTAMNALVRSGRNAVVASTTAAADLPPPLQTAEVADFLAQAHEPYTLEWTRTDLNRFRIPRPGRNFDSHAVVVARFANGWRLACLFVSPGELPECRSW
jgi:hypothetical protein